MAQTCANMREHNACANMCKHAQTVCKHCRNFWAKVSFYENKTASILCDLKRIQRRLQSVFVVSENFNKVVALVESSSSELTISLELLVWIDAIFCCQCLISLAVTRSYFNCFYCHCLKLTSTNTIYSERAFRGETFQLPWTQHKHCRSLFQLQGGITGIWLLDPRNCMVLRCRTFLVGIMMVTTMVVWILKLLVYPPELACELFQTKTIKILVQIPRMPTQRCRREVMR